MIFHTIYSKISNLATFLAISSGYVNKDSRILIFRLREKIHEDNSRTLRILAACQLNKHFSIMYDSLEEDNGKVMLWDSCDYKDDKLHGMQE